MDNMLYFMSILKNRETIPGLDQKVLNKKNNKK